MPNEYILSPWQTRMLNLFMHEWLSVPTRHKEVTLYLLGGQEVRGTLHFESGAIRKLGNYAGAKEKAIQQIISGGEIYLKLPQGILTTHVSCVVAYVI